MHAAPPLLPTDVLAKRDILPLKPVPITLEGDTVRLVPLDVDRDSDTLFAISNGTAIQRGTRHIDAYDPDELVWRWMGSGPFQTAGDLRAFLQAQVDAKNGLPLCVFDKASLQPVGVANFMSNSPQDLKIELGNIWYSPIAQRTHANLETTYLMLKHAFGLGYRRLEWKCNSLNERSRHSALRMGFKFEGIQEAHFIIKGRNRDTAWFRMLDHEWLTVKQHLETLLHA